MDFSPFFRIVSWYIVVLTFTTITTAYKPLSDSFLRAIPPPDHALNPQNGTLLAPLLIPRVPGTPGHKTVQHHIASYFARELPAWDISWQNSSSTTPLSSTVAIPFANFIAKREPPWTKPGEANLLTLVAHYDSKYAPEGFVGATDSAVPVAMLMWVAKVVDGYVSRMYKEMSELGEGGTVAMDMGIQILFLDGEEAFEKWSDTDSLYGARYVYNGF
jgi:glutaminyl-peptide cyclotransferase